MGSNLIVSQKKVFLVLLCSRRTVDIVRDNAKKINISRFILQGRIIISKIFYAFDVVYVQ